LDTPSYVVEELTVWSHHHIGVHHALP